MSSLSDTSVQFVKGVGPHKKKLFANLGIESIEDLFYFFPRRYEDRRQITPLSKVKVGEWQTIQGKVLLGESRKSWYTKKHVFEVTIDDGTGRIFCVWFNQPYQAHYFQSERRVVCFGKVDMYKNRLQMVSPEYELIEDDEQESLSINRIVPMYSLTRGMTQRFIRKIIWAALEKFKDQLIDELPVALRNKHRFYNIKRSLVSLHFPEKFEDQEEAFKRVSFEEFFFFQVSVLLRRLSITKKEGFAHRITDALALKFMNGFGFELTQAQKRVLREIRADLEKPSPMLRLLQGDVGSGKTLVALFGCLASFENNRQSAFMAPTEILARQHYETIQKLVGNGPLKGMKVCILVSSLKPNEKENFKRKIASGEIDLVVGTHALLTEDVAFKNLSYVIIDEQHKFGVRQRALLTEKGKNPDVLIMTATPIPRTLCITLYGDLDVSVIDEMPPGRGKIKTLLVKSEEDDKAYELARKKAKEGQQVYVIYPVIEESEKTDLKAAKDMYKQFKEKVFKEFRVGLVHGQMKQKESDETMKKFKGKEIDILVATTVLEVGIDVPNATVMMIEHAERFGLAQLHQLRGRIGRGEHDSLCILIAEAQSEEAQRRLKAILSTTDGFKIAQEDLLIRGPGRFFGRHQHGLNELKVANPATQLDILELARAEAKAILDSDPRLNQKEHVSILKIVKKRYPTYLQMVSAG
ncbi:MAG TPA: ATP-dependent DNA helicase RecG [Candidatus Omnitrophota bacterium]|nr:ATP-dependent DNA helicase RecG [Candidatus Omnitrophota bacterium]